MSMQNPNEIEMVSLPANFKGSSGLGTPEIKIPTQITSNSSLNDILVFARNEKASDVHIGAFKPVIFRKYGILYNATTEPLNAQQISQLISAALPKDLMEQFEKTGDAEYVHAITGFGRFRMAIIKQRNGWDLTARVVPIEIPKFETTGMPASCAGLTKWAQGLVLISGPAGCGKTTTLSVLVEMINRTRHDHIITIEEPIEIVFEPKKCQITQREIKIHSLNQTNALRAALREDPDILIVSELRDLKSIQLAVSAAETGHLVFGTMNTVNAIQTVSSIIDSFPAEEQSIIRNMISESLRGVICQQLVPRKDGTGVIPAYEVLIVTSPVANLIRSNKMTQINNAIITSKLQGMILMDTSLEMLVNKDLITKEDASDRSSNSAAMMQMLTNKTIPRSRFLEAVSNKEMVIYELMKLGILEEATSTEMRLKPNVELAPDIIRMITKDDYEKVWALIQELHTFNKQK